MGDPTILEPHGLDIAIRPDGVPELYLVNHGDRESIEIFEIRVGGLRPSLAWIGSVTMPEFTFGNDVAATPEGGFAVTSSSDTEGGFERSVARMAAGDETGKVVEWSPTNGWRTVPGSQISSANGVAVSADGAWLYVAGWRSRCIKKVSRGDGPVESHVVATDMMVDNLTWTSDGHLLAAGTIEGSRSATRSGWAPPVTTASPGSPRCERSTVRRRHGASMRPPEQAQTRLPF